MPTPWTSFVEGDSLLSAVLDGRFTDISGALNDLDGTAIQRESLRYNHAPSTLWRALGLYFPNGFQARCPDAILVAQDYANGIAVSAGPVLPLNYQAFDARVSTGAGAQPIYGPENNGGAVVASNVGWRIPSYDSQVANNMEVAVRVGGVAMTNTPWAGILCRANVEIQMASLGGLAWRANIVNQQNYAVQDSAIIGIGFRDGSNNMHVIEHTIRWSSTRNVEHGDFDTMTMITQDDLDLYGDGTIRDIFCVVASGCRGADLYVPGATNYAITYYSGLNIRRYSLACWPIMAGAL